jgi:hypothetical protein
MVEVAVRAIVLEFVVVAELAMFAMDTVVVVRLVVVVPHERAQS